MRAYDGCATCVVPRFSFGGKTGQASLHCGILVVRAACIPAETLLFLHEEVPRLARTRCPACTIPAGRRKSPANQRPEKVMIASIMIYFVHACK
jgi:hypothetical protein